MSKASLAVVAKVKTKFGKSLNLEDYDKLLSCQSLPEIVVYLKANTHYKDALLKTNENTIHRGQLEDLLSQYLFYEFGSLCRYETGLTSHFTTFITRNYEVKQIIHFLTLLNTGKEDDYILSLPTYFDMHTDINLLGIASAKNYNDFLEALNKTPFYKVLEKFKTKENKNLDLPAIDVALYTFIYKEFFATIDKHAHKNEKIELFKILNTIIDYNNLTRIVRLKKYYNVIADEIKKHLMPFGFLKKEQLNALINAETAEDVVNIMAKFKSGRFSAKDFFENENEFYHKTRYEISRKNLYFAVSPSAIVISFYFVMQNELLNIINIIEATRYGFNKEKLKKIIII